MDRRERRHRRFRHNNKKGPTAMPGPLRRDASNHLERLEDETDQFGIRFKRRSGHLFIAAWNEDAWYHWLKVDLTCDFRPEFRCRLSGPFDAASVSSGDVPNRSAQPPF
jgi:hypothetical protein